MTIVIKLSSIIKLVDYSVMVFLNKSKHKFSKVLKADFFCLKLFELDYSDLFTCKYLVIKWVHADFFAISGLKVAGILRS